MNKDKLFLDAATEQTNTKEVSLTLIQKRGS